MVKGSMDLIDTARAETLYSAMGPGVEISGGSAANTIAGVASLGSTSAYIGRVSQDQLGTVYTHDLRAAGVRFETAPATDGLPTGRCLIIVTPDAERTLNTYLGASSELTADDVDGELVRGAAYTYLEGYLWDSPAAQEAYKLAAEIAHGAGKKVALTLSDGFVVDRHRDTFLELIEGSVDVLFANDVEIQMLYEVDDFDTAIARVRNHCELAAVTRGPDGSVLLSGDDVITVPVEPIPGGTVVDTTGAGDLYAAGVLHGLVQGRDLRTCGRLGGLAAAEVISHLGARPQVSLAESAATAGIA
ncbi:MAG: adenosine kinase [Acidimicrobiia bacterium]|nr:adenosine kinase [Acidimicrobiia bacterium]